MSKSVRAVISLLIGAMAIGLAPIFVKNLIATNDVSPIGAGFWRMTVGCLGFLLILAQEAVRRGYTRENVRVHSQALWFVVLCGILFAMDLVAWHTSFNYTSVASSTLIANLSSIFVPISGVLFFGEQLTRKIIVGGSIAILGVVGLALFRQDSVGLHQQMAHSYFLGEGLAFLTAFLYTGYMLSMKKATQFLRASHAMALASGISAVILFAILQYTSLPFIPSTKSGWLNVLGLGLVSQLLGQGLIAAAMARLPVGIAALLLLSAPASSAVFGWIILGENLSLEQSLSILVTLTGIGIVSLRKRQMFPHKKH